MTNTAKMHSLRLEEMLAYPTDTLGITGVVWATNELVFYDEKGDISSEADLLFFTGDAYHIVEYKASKRRRDKAIRQLAGVERDVYRHFHPKRFNQDVYKRFAWYENNNYVHELVK